MWYNTTRPKYELRDATHESLYWPTVFPPWALAIRDGAEDESPQHSTKATKDTESQDVGT